MRYDIGGRVRGGVMGLGYGGHRVANVDATASGMSITEKHLFECVDC